MKYAVIVCGAGPTGTAAAIAAARKLREHGHEKKVLLLERYGFGGGMATGALVNPWAGHQYFEAGTSKVGSLIGGLFKEINSLLCQAGGFGSTLTQGAFDEERLKLVYDQLLQGAGVDILYHTTVTGVEREGRKITAVYTSSKEGSRAFYGDTIIDATGDGDLAAAAGCEWSLGRQSDQMTQAMTVSFRVGNVDKQAMIADLVRLGQSGHKSARMLVEPYFQKAIAEGRLHYPHREWVHFYDHPQPGILHFNMTRINQRNGLSAKDLTYAEMEGRRQAFVFADWLKQDVPYFKDSYLEKVAFQIGVRETRHVKGLYTMTADDITNAAKFDDAIVRSRYFIDIHSPTGSGFDHENITGYGAVAKNFDVPDGDYYEVPYRAIVPVGIDNLLVPCRALSATHEAAAAIRVMATMTGMGEAAGLAAAQSVERNLPFNEIDTARLRSQLNYLDEQPDYGYPWNIN